MKRKLLILTIAIIALLPLGCSSCDSGEDTVGLPDITNGESPNNLSAYANIPEGYVSRRIPAHHELLYAETVHENSIFYISYEEEQAVIVEINLLEPDIPHITPFAISPEQKVMYMTIGDDGSINILTYLYRDETASVYLDTIWMRVVRSANTLVPHEARLGEHFQADGWQHVTGFEISDSGKTYVSIGYDVYIFDAGEDFSTVSLASQITCGGIITRLFKDSTGVIYAAWFHETSLTVAAIDEEAGSLVDSHIVPFHTTFLGGGSSIIGSRDSIFLADGTMGYDYNLHTKSMTELFNWFDTGLFVTHNNTVFPSTDGHVILSARSDYFTAATLDFWLIRPQTEEDIIADSGEQTVISHAGLPSGEGDITLGTFGRNFGSDRAIQMAIIAFNQANPDSKIEIIDYGFEDTGLFQLNTDILRGNCPDILLVPLELSYGLYSQKGLFLDLLPYLENDPGFDWDDYQENIIRAYIEDGKLSAIPVSFSLTGMRGTTAELNGRTEWNLSEMVAFADRFPGSNLINRPTKAEALFICLEANGEHIVDWATEDGAFNRDLFIQILEFANRFHDADRIDVNSILADWEERVADDDLKLLHGGVSVVSTQRALTIFGEPITHIGYPSEKGSGFIIRSSNALAIKKDTEHGGTAWRFIQYLLSDSFQSSEEMGYLPVKKDSLDRKIEHDRIAMGSVGGAGGPTIDLRGATDEEIKEMRQILDTANKIRVYDLQIDAIIKEEADTYFSGQKTITEVADIVANRVGIYVKEAR
ncbi:MAG: ABC transporter substrate-binding protein [Lachnospiraceae bacterium]|jgi:ABC-type glycerol-3-phosphate transport system substrate-binding protein|nr:ABC transporter substrate-binding protein [Lachnospiraceae bacterium]